MKFARPNLSLRFTAGALVAAILATAAMPAQAQDSAAESRLRKIEAEVRAIQRKVFPGGDARFFEPQITSGSPPASSASGSVSPPSTTAVTDILARLDAMEGQLQALTARSEEQANTLSLLETRLAALEQAQAQPGAPQLSVASTTPGDANPAAITGSGAPAGPVAATTAVTPAPTPGRLAAVQAIAKPQTDDAGDDEYSYGFRLWNAGFYPEARQQLTKFVEQYASHPRISFGRNLLGRAFLDDNLPEEAARWFLRNYQANKNGDRAPDSLLYLGASMIAMKDTKRACIALAEFADTYPAVATGRLASEYQVNRAKVTCN